VPSLHLAVAPAGLVFPEDDGDAPVELAVVAGLAGAGAAAGAVEPAGAGVAAGAEEALAEEDCTPPWLLQAPRPVAVDVVPSLQTVGAAGVVSAPAGSDQANASKDTAANDARECCFIGMTPYLLAFCSASGRIGRSGKSVMTRSTYGV
jgi:hypothetical protein